MTLPTPDHPRYTSLLLRERIVKGIEMGITAKQGLVAHGRGETFDYLIGECTTDWAQKACKASAAHIILAENPVISVNGNVAVLCPEEVRDLAKTLKCKVEINLFHRTPERMEKIFEHLVNKGIEAPIGMEPDCQIPNLDHERGKATRGGIYDADVVIVPLEDGDRTQALRAMGKAVITIDLNPLSRTSRTASITIVDNVLRALPAIQEESVSLEDLPRDELRSIIDNYDNASVIAGSIEQMRCNLDTVCSSL